MTKGALLRLFSPLTGLILSALMLSLSTTTVAEPSNISQLKAAYYFNALKFALWPSQRLAEKEPLIIILLGTDPVCSILAKKLPGYQINGHRIVVKLFSLEQAKDADNRALLNQAHAIYFAEDTSGDYTVIIDSLDRPILTGSSIPKFSSHGGMVEIAHKKQQQKLGFHINISNLKRSSMAISAKLMKIATIIDPQSLLLQPSDQTQIMLYALR